MFFEPVQYLGVNGKNYYAKPWGNDSSNIQACRWWAVSTKRIWEDLRSRCLKIPGVVIHCMVKILWHNVEYYVILFWIYYYYYLLLYTILYCYTRGKGLDKSLCQPMESCFGSVVPGRHQRPGILEVWSLECFHLVIFSLIILDTGWQGWGLSVAEPRDICKVLHAVTLSISPLSLWVANQWFQSVSQKITEKSRITQGTDNILLVLNVGNWGMGWWLIVTIDYNYK